MTQGRETLVKHLEQEIILNVYDSREADFVMDKPFKTSKRMHVPANHLICP